jgi:hypothetical protein
MSESWFNPNAQAVGVEIGMARDAEPDDDADDRSEADVESDEYDPGAHTVDEVKAYVEAHPDERAAVLAAENSGRERVTLLEWLGAPNGWSGV